MENGTITCPICGRKDATRSENMEKMKYSYSCKNCTEFSIPTYDLEYPEFREKLIQNKAILSGVCRHIFEDGQGIAPVSIMTISDLLKSEFVPEDLSSKFECLQIYIGKKSRNVFFEFTVDETIFPSVAYLNDNKELSKMLQMLSAEGVIETVLESASGRLNYKLTLRGIKEIQAIRSPNKQSEQAFIAMWFDPSLNDACANAFAFAIEQCGYKPKRIDQAPFNTKICDEIVASIKSSRFIIADFTGNRGGVYFEAGYAMGFGIPVIYTCRKDWFATKRKEQLTVKAKNGKLVPGIHEVEESVHFDVNHYHFIVWESVDDLKEKLIARISATIGEKTVK